MTDIQKIYDGYFERMKSMALTLKFLNDSMLCFEFSDRKKLEPQIKFLEKELEDLAVNIAETGEEIINNARPKLEIQEGHGEKCTVCETVCNTFSANVRDLPTA